MTSESRNVGSELINLEHRARVIERWQKIFLTAAYMFDSLAVAETGALIGHKLSGSDYELFSYPTYTAAVICTVGGVVGLVRKARCDAQKDRLLRRLDRNLPEPTFLEELDAEADFIFRTRDLE